MCERADTTKFKPGDAVRWLDTPYRKGGESFVNRYVSSPMDEHRGYYILTGSVAVWACHLQSATPTTHEVW